MLVWPWDKCYNVSEDFCAPSGEKEKDMKRTLTLILAAALIVTCLSGCGLFRREAEPVPDEQADSVAQLVDRCRTACNELDIEGILNCLHPTAAKPLRSVMKLASGLSGKDEDKVLEQLCVLLGADASDPREFCRTLRTELGEVETQGDRATAPLRFIYEVEGEPYMAEVSVTCTCIDGTWYISRLEAK